jgi:hypothetical protein
MATMFEPNRRGMAMGPAATTTTVRIPKEISAEIARIAALRGQSSGDLLVEAWKAFLADHKDIFARQMEEVADIIRGGTTEDLAAFISQDVDARAAAAAESAAQAAD